MTTTAPGPRVVVGVDGSEMSYAALQWAERYARMIDGNLHLVAAWEWPVSYGVSVISDDFDPEADATGIAEKAAASLSLPPDRVSVTVVEGSPRTTLTRKAADADLLVVGSRGHSAIGGLLLGSVSSYCVHHATVPVVVVR